MKKAKIMLLAIAIIGAGAGALAFRSSKFFQDFGLYVTTAAGKTYCITIAGFTTTNVNQGVPFSIYKTLTTTPNAYFYTTKLAISYYCTSPTFALNGGND